MQVWVTDVWREFDGCVDVRVAVAACTGEAEGVSNSFNP